MLAHCAGADGLYDLPERIWFFQKVCWPVSCETPKAASMTGTQPQNSSIPIRIRFIVRAHCNTT